MTEYRCGKCGGTEFKVDTSQAVFVQCRDCLRGEVEPSVAEAFAAISKKTESTTPSRSEPDA